jgi:hypothetical protein
MTDDDTMALLARVRWLEAEVQRLIERAAQAEADRDVLAAEVRAWRDADTWHELLEVMDMCDDYSHRHDVEKAKKEVDASGSLTRAKEAK